MTSLQLDKRFDLVVFGVILTNRCHKPMILFN